MSSKNPVKFGIFTTTKNKIREKLSPILKRIHRFSSVKKISIVYLFTAFIFIFYHESHLPWFIILLLAISTLIFTLALFLLGLAVFKFLFGERNNPFFEVLFLGILVVVFYKLGFMEYSGGSLFLLITCVIAFFFKFTGSILYYRISLIGISIFMIGLLTFYYLQANEKFLFYYFNQSKYGELEKDFTNWTYDKATRTLSNADIPLTCKLPEEFVFYNPKDLDLKDKTGAGQIAGILSTGAVDPNLYPFVRIFYLPKNLNMDKEQIRLEFSKLLEVGVNRGEFEELKELGAKPFSPKNWDGYFWVYFDPLRPRHAKTGFYLVNLPLGGRLVLHLTENVTKEFHEPKIKEILESIN